MAIDVDTRESPGWWLMRLAKKLESRQERLKDLNDRFEGRPPDKFGIQGKAAEVYRAFKAKAGVQYPELIVEAARERMQLVGFKTGADDGDDGDQVAHQIMRANRLSVDQADVHTHMLSLGDAYGIVFGRDDSDLPVITGEDPRQVVTIHDPIDQSQVRAAAKIFHDTEADEDVAFLWLPGEQHVAVKPRRARGGGVRFSSTTWDWDDDRTHPLPFDDLMPVVRLRNKRGVGEFERHVDLIDRISHMILQRMVIATLQAFRQRAVKGLPDEDDEGNPIDWEDVFVADPGALWKVPQSVEFWESGQGNIGPILESVKEDVREVAAVTRTPVGSLLPDGANQSAEGAAFHREALVLRVEDRITRAGEFWCDLMSSALRIAGETDRADRSQITALWKPANRLSLAERADASVKARDDLPLRWRLEYIWQFTPTQVDEIMQDRVADQLLTVPDEPPEGTAA